MAYPPGQNITVRNNGVGLVSTTAALPLVVGHTTGGTPNTLYQYTNPNALRDEQVSGPALEVALAAIASAGGCLLLVTAASTAGVASAVDKAAAGSSTGTMAVSGVPALELDVRIEITTTGALGEARFRYTLDGVTFGVVRVIPSGGTFEIPETGLTLTFTAGAGPVHFEEGDVHTFTTSAPHYTTTDLGGAWTALLAQIGSRRIRRVVFSGRNATASDGATMAGAIAGHMETLEAEHYYARALCDAGEEADPAAVIVAFGAFAHDRVALCYGDARMISRAPFEGYANVRQPILRAVAERAFAADLSENLGRKASGALTGVTQIFHDEGTDTAFSEADKIVTLRTFRGQPGFYITNGYLRSPAGSDFLYWDWGIVVDELCEGVVEGQDKWLLSKLRARTDGSGNLTDEDAKRVEDAVLSVLNIRLKQPDNIEGFKGHVSGHGYTVDRTNDFLASRTLISTANAVPLSPVESIQTTIGLARSI